MKYVTKKIVYDQIPEKLFKEMINVLKKYDLQQAEKESKDGFLDMYLYWNKAGLDRFKTHLRRLHNWLRDKNNI